MSYLDTDKMNIRTHTKISRKNTRLQNARKSKMKDLDTSKMNIRTHTKTIHTNTQEQNAKQTFQTISCSELIFPQGPLIFPLIKAFIFGN